MKDTHYQKLKEYIINKYKADNDIKGAEYIISKEQLKSKGIESKYPIMLVVDIENLLMPIDSDMRTISNWEIGTETCKVLDIDYMSILSDKYMDYVMNDEDFFQELQEAVMDDYFVWKKRYIKDNNLTEKDLMDENEDIDMNSDQRDDLLDTLFKTYDNKRVECLVVNIGD